MERNLALDCSNDNAPTEPDYLVIHCPRETRVMPWDDLSRYLLEWFRSKGWTIDREPDAFVAHTPWRPEVMQ